MYWTSTDMLAHKLSNIFADNIVTGHKTYKNDSSLSTMSAMAFFNNRSSNKIFLITPPLIKCPQQIYKSKSNTYAMQSKPHTPSLNTTQRPIYFN